MTGLALMPRADHPEYSICEIFRGDRAVGLGLAISQEHVATCAHVVNSALGQPDLRDLTRPGEGAVIRLRFTIGTTTGDDRYRDALVIGWLPVEAETFDIDDIAVLELAEPAPAHVRVPRPARYRPGMPVQMWGPQPGRPAGGHVKGELLGEVRDGRIQIRVSGGPFRVRAGFSGGPVWDPISGDVVGVLSACGAEDDATDAYLLLMDRIRTGWPGKKERLIIRRLHAESHQLVPFTVLIDDVEEQEKVADGGTASFDVTPGKHTVRVKSGECESVKRTVYVRTSYTLTTKLLSATAPANAGASSRSQRLVLRPQGQIAAIAVFSVFGVFACICLFLGLLYLKDVSFADYVTDQWHWYGSPWSVAAGDCLHDDTRTYSSDGPMVVVPCPSAAADYTLLGVFSVPVNETDPGCEYVQGWSAAAGGETVLGDSFGHQGEILCAMPR
jgi:hypothetical protein